MPLEAPKLDDRRFNDLFEELKSKIPHYTPEWTDHNLSDPGITLMQLFAWLGDIILYRLNRVPERNYIEFLRLFGIEQTPAAPAKAELTFTLVSPDTSSVVIPKGTQVTADISPPAPSTSDPPTLTTEGAEPVIFETDEALIAVGAQLKYEQTYDGVRYSVRARDEEEFTTGARYYPFGRLARQGSALLLGFASDAGFPTDEINLYVRVYTDPNLLSERSCDDSASVSRAPADIVWEYWDGAEWRKLRVLKDETRAFTRSGHVYFTGPRDVKKDMMGAVTSEELYWLRCRLADAAYEIAPELEAVLTNTVKATAAVTVRDEVAGSSNGQPDQRFVLRNAPIYAGDVRPVEERLRESASWSLSLTEAEREAFDRALRERELKKGFLLEVQESGDSKPWEEVENFFSSGPSDLHYVLSRSTGEIRFGDGQRGCIPNAGTNNIVARYYRYGGGAAGNVGAGKVTDASVSGVDSVTNYWPAEGGADEEPVEDTKARAPKELKTRHRAVTAEDFEFLARQTPGVRVRRAHALPLYHPQFPDVEVPGVITVIVIPESKDVKPVPSEATMEAVCDYLRARRLLTTELFVAPPQYRQVKIEASVLAAPSADPAGVKTNIEKALTTYLDPLKGGSDGQGWPLGGDVLYSDIFRVILDVEGVQRVDDMRISVDGERMDRCEDASVPRDQLVFSDGHDINVRMTA